jgi:hypothetical protein
MKTEQRIKISSMNIFKKKKFQYKGYEVRLEHWNAFLDTPLDAAPPDAFKITLVQYSCKPERLISSLITYESIGNGLFWDLVKRMIDELENCRSVYVVYESQGGYAELLSKIFYKIEDAYEFIEQQRNPKMWRVQKERVE